MTVRWGVLLPCQKRLCPKKWSKQDCVQGIYVSALVEKLFWSTKVVTDLCNVTYSAIVPIILTVTK